MLTTTAIRYAEPDDLGALAAIEASGDVLFEKLSRARGLDHRVLGESVPGEQRAAQPGFLLVAGQPVCGFAHVLDLGGHLHLEQVSVHADVRERGIGTSLLRAALGAALDRGVSTITLRTFAEVAWNGPFYARHGFVEVPDPPWVEGLVAAERAAGLERWGRRITMACEVRDEPAPVPAVSVIPIRDGPSGIEAFVQHRVATMDFAAGAVVFPGGRIDRIDRTAQLDVSADLLEEHAAAWAGTGAAALSGSAHGAARLLLATGVREVREEAAAVIDPAGLIPWDNWITPIDCPKRFDVYFFLAAVTPDRWGEWRHTTTEASDSRWEPLAGVAAAAEAGEVLLLPPTRTIIDELIRLGDAATAASLRPRVSAVHHDIIGRRPRRPGRPADGAV
ncbi:MAG: GNAT family N-acetyltransferase [Tetrasphaera sp.]